jgi:hypothetical protein
MNAGNQKSEPKKRGRKPKQQPKPLGTKVRQESSEERNDRDQDIEDDMSFE